MTVKSKLFWMINSYCFDWIKLFWRVPLSKVWVTWDMRCALQSNSLASFFRRWSLSLSALLLEESESLLESSLLVKIDICISLSKIASPIFVSESFLELSLSPPSLDCPVLIKIKILVVNFFQHLRKKYLNLFSVFAVAELNNYLIIIKVKSIKSN